MEMHFATVYECIADLDPGLTALVDDVNRRSWGEYDRRAACLANFFQQAGLKKDAKVALYTYNRNEYLEAQLAAFKMRAIPVNVNYRYLDDELVYLLNDTDAEVVIFEGCFAERLMHIKPQISGLHTYVQVNDGHPRMPGAYDYEEIIAAHEPAPRIQRSEDDIYMLYTGGTTGMPKGVMYRMGVFFRNMLKGYDFCGLERPKTTEELIEKVAMRRREGHFPAGLPASPLMHGAGMWGAVFMPGNLGAKTVCVSRHSFDADAIWQAVEREKVTDMTIVGDVFGKPMIDALKCAEAAGKPYDVSSVERILSSGVMWTADVKAGFLAYMDALLIDAMGSSEGSMARQLLRRGGNPTTAEFELNDKVVVLNENDQLVEPGSGDVGMLAVQEGIPFAYYKDPEKSAKTFRRVNGVDYCFPGDFATVEADGKITLLGRGSVCINTGGEKVFPEEVEEVIKAMPGIKDCLVVGLPDSKYGERVTALVTCQAGLPTSEQGIIDQAHKNLSGYKIPKQVFMVEMILRGPNGKADYKWAKQQAAALSEEIA